MKKKIVKGFCDIFLNLRLVLDTILLTAIICVPICVAGTGYARAKDHMTLLSRSKQSGEWQTVRMRVTAYCPCEECCGKYSDGVTACGHKIRPGDAFVAADKEYSFGTEIIIDGYSNGQPVKVLDRGGVIGGNRLDVFFGSHEEALEWGVRYVAVKVRRK